MVWFIPFLLLVAAAWAVVGILLARYLKQAGYNKPIKGRSLDASEIYGGGVGFGNQEGLQAGSSRDPEGMRVGRGGQGRPVMMGQYGGGRFKGL
ncbi:hypothetical protein EK21DRAFT_58432 [Setomelanomma holmii]|uniref:Uncharacterized protein n=1 Tax=Setomelanomma holmii TaxID=210430 RepID=A0A9P4HHV5_9PLEO|nr:hypothetical protein EK21DRAFT_58432 [Setomelanomma holmii]